MANHRFIMTMSILLSLAFLATSTSNTTTTADHKIATDYDFDRTANVVVEGKVYCQGCKYIGSSSLSGAEPIWAARVSVICKNYKKRVSYYKAFVTDYDGYFYADLKKFRMTHYLLDHPLHACRVKLVSSPHETCNVRSNLNNGINGSPLRFENKVLYGRGYETVIYASGPFAFRSSDCYPDTTP
ncbi:hypothetical protein L2E82_32011 [Cichorium intybus]|uniref:Uncharacterized protein n=1 Tax=Cichorium intybus TaxID=13427 RepID=A0ACB9BF79_CICIN|nr:hypothetical protein L2E82_32011 [Cichorium intybus]